MDLKARNVALVSIVIINYNGKVFLHRCIDSVLQSKFKNFEIIFVDNNSSDGSADYLKNNFQDDRIAIHKADKNYGVPGGRNIGFLESRGEFVVFLDNDTEVDKDWLGQLLEVFQSDEKIAVAQCKLLNFEERNRFDHAGDYLTPFGFLCERSKQGLDRGQFDNVDEIFSSKGAAMMVRSSIFRGIGMFDSSYFMYLEETDFCMRVWLAGYKVVFVPKSIVWHAYGTSLKDVNQYYSTYVVRFYGSRNYISTLIKNLSLKNLVVILPFHLLGWLVLSLLFLFKGKFKDSYWILKGIAWNIINLVPLLKKRVSVQRNTRKVKDSAFFKKVIVSRGISFYLKKASCYVTGKHFRE
ncbi:glycosyltransferase family 2 protein [Thermoproteota archaeon]